MRRIWTLSAKAHGANVVEFAWSPDGNLVASTGSTNKFVYVTDRHGTSIAELKFTGDIRSLAWDYEGEKLAILFSNSQNIALWDVNRKQVTEIDTGQKDLTYCCWAKAGPELAIATAKGNLVIYNRLNQRKQPIIGKHTKKITCGAWDRDGILALGGEDKLLTTSRSNGDPLRQKALKGEPSMIKFGSMRDPNDINVRIPTLSLNNGKKGLYLQHYKAETMNDFEVNFSADYRGVQCYDWFGDGYICVGFADGHFVVASTHMSEMGKEVFASQPFHRCFNSVAVNEATKKVAVAGDDRVVVYDLSVEPWKECDSVVLPDETVFLDTLAWTPDGQILTVSTKTGSIINFLTQLPVLGASYLSYVVFLSALKEVHIINTQADPNVPALRVPLQQEPSFMALGPNDLAVGMNNQVWFYPIPPRPDGMPAMNKQYLGAVLDIQLNATWVAAMAGGKIQLHPASAATAPAGREMKMFPERDNENDISCMSLTDDFLIYGTTSGQIVVFYIVDWAVVSQFKLPTGGASKAIRRVFPNRTGTRIVFVDDRNAGFVYNPSDDYVVPINDFPVTVTDVFWDQNPRDWGVFVGVDDDNVTTFVYNPTTVNGPTVTRAGVTPRPLKHKPLLLNSGRISSLSATGVPSHFVLETHANTKSVREMDVNQYHRAFQQNLALNRLEDAWRVALVLNNEMLWAQLGRVALEALEVNLATRVYRQIGDAGMVLALDQISRIEDQQLLMGHVHMLFANYDEAQAKFVASSKAITALEMRRDLLHWDQALRLAKTLAPKEVPYICRECAQGLEFKGEYPKALEMFAKGLEDAEPNSDHVALCNAGIARNTIRTGDLSRGIQMAVRSNNKALCRDCASILEGLKQFNDAAMLYEKATSYEKAVQLYIQTKNTAAAQAIMGYITTPSLHILYAKTIETLGQYREAEAAYETAKAVNDVIRLNLDHLKNPDKAFRLMRENPSVEGARLVARFCQNVGDFPSAIEFLLMAESTEEAFSLASTHHKMDAYARLLGDGAAPDDYINIANYYEDQKNPMQAGVFFYKAEQYARALKLFIEAGEKSMEVAIRMIGEARNDALTHQLIDYLSGKNDDQPKDPKWIYQVYVALEKFAEAGEVAVTIAKAQQDHGLYKEAHTTLYDAAKRFLEKGVRQPQDMKNILMVNHSYLLVKSLVKLNQRQAAARMLIRVAGVISKFPMHIVPILTSTVIECHQSGLKQSAYEYAAMLMRDEYRAQIGEKYKKKIEGIVRRPEQDGDMEEATAPCPVCQYALPETQLYCPSCKTDLPYCIASGRHMTLAGWTQCPSCRFPAMDGSITLILNSEDPSCPMCTVPLRVDQLIRPAKPLDALRALLEGAKGS